MSTKLITAPEQEPWTLEMAKAYLRISIDAEDDLLREFLRAARRWVESETKRALISQVWEYALQTFPRNDIVLPWGRALSVVEIRYRDSSDSVVTLTGPTSTSPGTDYQEDLSGDEGGRVAPVPGASWPDAKPDRLNAVVVKYTAGYSTDPDDLPPDLRMAVLYRMSDLNEYRGAFDGEGTAKARAAIDNYRLDVFA